MEKVRSVLIGAGLMLAGASAYALDYAEAVTSATTEINSAMNAALPVGIIVLSAVIGWRLFKRFAKG